MDFSFEHYKSEMKRVYGFYSTRAIDVHMDTEYQWDHLSEYIKRQVLTHLLNKKPVQRLSEPHRAYKKGGK